MDMARNGYVAIASVPLVDPIRRTSITNRFLVLIVGLAVAAVSLPLIRYGVDFQNYSRYFDVVRNASIEDLLLGRIEPLFVVLVAFLTRLTPSDVLTYWLLLLISLELKLLVIAGRASLSRWTTWAVICFYLLRFFPLHELTQIRASIALAIALLAFDRVGSRFTWPLMIAALLIHYSMLTLVPFFLMLKFLEKKPGSYVKHEKTIWYVTILAAIVVAIYAAPAIDEFARFFTVLRIYQYEGFGTDIRLLNAAVLTDLFGLLTAFAVVTRMRLRTRFWVYVQFAGVITFFAFHAFPIVAYRLREVISILWLFYVLDAFQDRAVVRWHAAAFIVVCIPTWAYIFLVGRSAIFPL
jgi:hypothetical protein